MSKFLYALLIAVCGFSAPILQGAITYRSGEGWQIEGEDQSPAARTAAEQFHRAEDAEDAGDLRRALVNYRKVVRRFPNSFTAPRAQFQIGALLERLDDPGHAFDAYAKYVTKYQHSADFEQAVEAQFNIAKRFLEGERVRALGVKTFSSMSKAQDMFHSIVVNAPFSKFAPLAQFNYALAIEKEGRFDEAIAAYKELLNRYSSEPIAADAQYQIGYLYLKEARGGSYDRTVREKSREAFEDFASRYPNSEKLAQAKENLDAVTSRQTGSSMEIAKFYDKQRNYRAAVIYYNDVIKQQPGSTQGEAAKTRIEQLKNKFGEDALKPGPERTETGSRAQVRRKLQAQVDTAARSDYVGPPVSMPEETPPPKPKLRTSSSDIGPVPAVEPTLPSP
ncbi:MAG: outer membrane protein assembly factor BamD [Verrucomicrobiota bacterium]|nr:outer membrane protein assembly factor BamD [Verrucomicrobiota bacterium]